MFNINIAVLTSFTVACYYGVLEQLVYIARAFVTSKYIKARLIQEWQKFDQKIIDWTVNQ